MDPARFDQGIREILIHRFSSVGRLVEIKEPEHLGLQIHLPKLAAGLPGQKVQPFLFLAVLEF